MATRCAACPYRGSARRAGVRPTGGLGRDGGDRRSARKGRGGPFLRWRPGTRWVGRRRRRSAFGTGLAAAPRVSSSGHGRAEAGGRFGLYDETIRAGEYSDDTQLALAVARCRANHGEDWWKAWVRMELPRWTLYERWWRRRDEAGGAGLAGRCAVVAGGHDRRAPPRYFGAGGNGVAARVLPARFCFWLATTIRRCWCTTSCVTASRDARPSGGVGGRPPSARSPPGRWRVDVRR